MNAKKAQPTLPAKLAEFCRKHWRPVILVFIGLGILSYWRDKAFDWAWDTLSTDTTPWELHLKGLQVVTKIDSENLLLCNPGVIVSNLVMNADPRASESFFPPMPRMEVPKQVSISAFFVLYAELLTYDNWTITEWRGTLKWRRDDMGPSDLIVLSNRPRTEPVIPFTEDELSGIAESLRAGVHSVFDTGIAVADGTITRIIDTLHCVASCESLPLELNTVVGMMDPPGPMPQLDVHRATMQFQMARNLRRSEWFVIPKSDEYFSFVSKRIVLDTVMCNRNSMVTVISMELDTVIEFSNLEPVKTP